MRTLRFFLIVLSLYSACLCNAFADGVDDPFDPVNGFHYKSYATVDKFVDLHISGNDKNLGVQLVSVLKTQITVDRFLVKDKVLKTLDDFHGVFPASYQAYSGRHVVYVPQHIENAVIFNFINNNDMYGVPLGIEMVITYTDEHGSLIHVTDDDLVFYNRLERETLGAPLGDGHVVVMWLPYQTFPNGLPNDISFSFKKSAQKYHL